MKNELPEEKGFSETNLKRMVQFCREYPGLGAIGAQAAPHATIAQSLLKDPYLFDFFTLEEPFHERKLVSSLPSIEDIENELTDDLRMTGHSSRRRWHRCGPPSSASPGWSAWA